MESKLAVGAFVAPTTQHVTRLGYERGWDQIAGSARLRAKSILGSLHHEYDLAQVVVDSIFCGRWRALSSHFQRHLPSRENQRHGVALQTAS